MLRERKESYLSGYLTVAGLFFCFFTGAQFLSQRVITVGQYPSCLQGTFFDNTTSLSGKSHQLFRTATLEIFVAMNGVV